MTNSDLRLMCDRILQLLATVPEMEPLLWPKCLDYLLDPRTPLAAPAVVKCCSQLAKKKAKDKTEEGDAVSNGNGVAANDLLEVDFDGFEVKQRDT